MVEGCCLLPGLTGCAPREVTLPLFSICEVSEGCSGFPCRSCTRWAERARRLFRLLSSCPWMPASLPSGPAQPWPTAQPVQAPRPGGATGTKPV